MSQSFLPEESNNKLQSKETQSDEAQPRVQAIEVGFGRLGEVVRLEDRQKSQCHTWNGQSMKEHVKQFHIDVLQTATQTIQ